MTSEGPTTGPTPRVGCVYRPQTAPERIGAAAAAADAAGLDELWLWEDCFLAGGISAAAIALSHSSRLTVGVGVLPVPVRNVALAAMEIATLARAFPGRLRIGVGHGVQDWMAQIGERVGSPMTLLREYLTCLTALLRGERVTFHGRYVDLDEVQLDWPPDPAPGILAAAVGPKTLRLSGELAAGTVITGGTSPDQLRDAVSHIRAGQGSGAHRHSVVTYLLCTTGADAGRDLRDEIGEWGFDPRADVGVSGSAEEIAGAAHRWLRAGADTLVFQPRATAPIEEFVEFVGTQVAPLLRR
ncbi:LLM class flavin-dependent oxidoreductase [Mycolicibacterium chlorophenolicum]|uniref:Phthiodiolone/phenolphthiodiolone dimycocerosates ketoreductase n=1 Tax=Mycolicibacterium chlorophenolicum TaxID=37916 RepID=A0A0J6VW31_9MYCO|nr:LLM class flavin-dependent oxidoreductase [Mycolicibacterium chlorophenolicum]KMO75310.1 Phthiodiolone/phenolphthiodiolone dimycocerosates ketoreductase [Mycolicibacterium chlorophenolicum]